MGRSALQKVFLVKISGTSDGEAEMGEKVDLGSAESVNRLMTVLWGKVDQSTLENICENLIRISETETVKSKEQRLTFLRLLGTLIYERAGLLVKFHGRLFGEKRLLLCSENDAEICLAACLCIRNCCMKSPGDPISETHQLWCIKKTDKNFAKSCEL